MARYYVNDRAQPNGDHEVHKDGCSFMPSAAIASLIIRSTSPPMRSSDWRICSKSWSRCLSMCLSVPPPGAM